MTTYISIANYAPSDDLQILPPAVPEEARLVGEESGFGNPEQVLEIGRLIDNPARQEPNDTALSDSMEQDSGNRNLSSARPSRQSTVSCQKRNAKSCLNRITPQRSRLVRCQRRNSRVESILMYSGRDANRTAGVKHGAHLQYKEPDLVLECSVKQVRKLPSIASTHPDSISPNGVPVILFPLDRERPPVQWEYRVPVATVRVNLQ